MKPIRNISELSVSELLTEFSNNDNELFLSELDLRNHIRKNTNNFEPALLTVLHRDISEFIFTNPISDKSLLQDYIFELDCLLLNIANENNLSVDLKNGNGVQFLSFEKQAHIFPVELQTVEAKQVIAKAVELNLCSVDNGVYSWGETKALLAYFADRASEYLQLGKGIYDDKIKISWKPFEMLFRIKGLAQTKKDYQRTGNTPIGFDIVEKIFD
ncbi:MAG: hypothetical protein EOM44_09720 [Bacteroidia bacterium]|nr:hypothetical protein [Bacteroidia bacterium]